MFSLFFETKHRRALPLLLSFLAIAPFAVRAQNSEDVHAAGSNLLRVGDGSTTDALGNTTDKRYFEEIANARIFFQNFSLGLRYELDDPSEVGRSYQDRNFRKRWLAYRKDQIDLQAGDVSALFGRGLAVNLFESRPLNYDSWLDGLFGKTEYNIPKELVDADMSVAVRGVGGKEDFYPIPISQGALSVADTLPMHISARAINGELGFWKHKVSLGAVFLEANVTGDLLSPGLTAMRNVNQPDFYADINSGEFEGYFEWTQNRTQVTELLGTAPTAKGDTSHTGQAMYGSLSYSNSQFGITFEYKNYDYFRHPVGDLYQDVFSKLPISSPPEVYKDFTFTSITRSTHAVWFDDELGMQAEVNITAVPRWTIDLYGAASSRHDKYNISSVAVDSTNLLPRFTDNGFYPFWETYAEAEWDFNPETDQDYIRFAIHRRSDVISYSPADSSAETKYATTVAAKFQYETTPNQSILAIWEHQWAYDGSILTPDKRRLNELITLQYSFNPTINFGAILDLSIQYENGPYHLEDNWPQGFVSLRMGHSHTLLMSYGSERGGLNCTGGICRVVPPFKGLRLTLTSQI